MKGFSLSTDKFFNGYVPLKEITYDITIIYINNFQKDVYDIKNPWSFIKGMNKNPNVKACFIKQK